MTSREGDATSLRDASFTDLPRLQEIERQAGEVFRAVGMSTVADDKPLGLDLLRGHVERGQAWVIADHADVPVAYLLADVVDGAGHVEQVTSSRSRSFQVMPGRAWAGCSWIMPASGLWVTL